MNSSAIIEHTTQPVSASAMREQVGVIQDVLKNVMQQNVHYGVIPGCKEPSLYKPGAEKIMASFRLSADPEITNLSSADLIRYQVKVRLTSPSGVFVGAGIGECSSDEEKYKWRKVVCQEEYDETSADRKREKWNRGWNNNPPYKTFHVRTEPADLANTILKMAKKRALVDAVLTATAASDCFTQDIEDLPPEYRAEEPTGPKAQAVPVKSQGPAHSGGAATEKQVKLLKSKLARKNINESWLCDKFKLDAIESLPFSSVNEAIKAIDSHE